MLIRNVSDLSVLKSRKCVIPKTPSTNLLLALDMIFRETEMVEMVAGIKYVILHAINK